MIYLSKTKLIEVKYKDKKIPFYVFDTLENDDGIYNDMISLNAIERKVFFESKLLDYWKDKFGTVKNFVDIGANIGNHTVFAREILKAKTFSFEPQINNFEVLKLNSKGEIYNVALGKENARGSLEIGYGNINFKGGGVSPCLNMGRTVLTQGNDIEIKKLDSFNLSPDLIKIDVEGNEYDVVLGSLETLKKYKPVLYIEHNDPTNKDKTEKLLNSIGYKITNLIDTGDNNYEYSYCLV